MTNIRSGSGSAERPPDRRVLRLGGRRGARSADAGAGSADEGARPADAGAGSADVGHQESDCIDGRSSGNEQSRKDGLANGGTDEEAYARYADEEYGYRVVYPTDWFVETEPVGGASFGARGMGDAGAVVFVDDGIDALDAYVEAFMNDLRADDHIHAFEPATRRDLRLESGQSGQLVECPYVGDSPGETWQLMYLFTVVDGVGYTLGMDWSDDEAFGEDAARIVESFAIEED